MKRLISRRCELQSIFNDRGSVVLIIYTESYKLRLLCVDSGVIIKHSITFEN